MVRGILGNDLGQIEGGDHPATMAARHHVSPSNKDGGNIYPRSGNQIGWNHIVAGWNKHAGVQPINGHHQLR